MKMLQSDDINTRVHQWVLGNFPLAKERNIGPFDSLLESGIIDSLGTLDIVFYLEREFGLVVEDEEMVADHFESISSIANFIDRKSVR